MEAGVGARRENNARFLVWIAIAALISMGLSSARLDGPYAWETGAAQADGLLTISGNAGVAGASLTYTGGPTTADEFGLYTITISSGWSGTVTPLLGGYSFTPVQRSYSYVASDLVDQDFTAGPQIFADVPVLDKEWMQPWVENFYSKGITTGCAASPLRYCPENPVTRAAMAVFVLRVIEGSSYVPPPASHFFSDMPVAGKEWMEPFVDEFYRRGITGGCGPGPIYCPENPVTRAAMAVFLLRAIEGSSYVPPPATHTFSDVPVIGKEWMEPFVDEFYLRGITTGCGANPARYCPENPVTRAAMAVFLGRAFNLMPAPLDTTAPAAILDLSALTGTVHGTVELGWTAPGDDEASGTAAQYLVRYSDAEIITETDWDNASVVPSGIPAPQAAGGSESMTVTGLTAGSTYFFSVRAQDEVPNRGHLSNGPSALAFTDITPPAVIANLIATTGTTEGSVNLAWTAPGDDGIIGTAAAYLVKWRADGVIDTEEKWNTATGAGGTVPTPQAAGSPESMTVTGLTPGATYYFSVRAQDEAPNTGALPTSPSAVAALDTVAPAAITNLAATSGALEGTVNLTWTAPGDNGILGTAQTYLVRHATAEITLATWDAADPVSTGVPTSSASGVTESMTVTSGLTSGVTYFFAVKTLDEVSNFSLVSNSPSAAAAADIVPPAAIGDLVAATGANMGEIDLTWTAPGDNGTTGTAAAYIVKDSPTEILTETDWVNAIAAEGTLPTPQAPGGTETMTVTGLTGGTTYYFAVRAEDEVAEPGGALEQPECVANGHAADDHVLIHKYEHHLGSVEQSIHH